MKFRLGIILLILITVISCGKKTILETTFDCSHATFSDVKEVKDVKNNFKIGIPSDWKINKYFDEYESSVFVADTLKQLTDTFIIDVSYKLGELKLNQEFVAKVNADSTLSIIHSEFENMFDKPAFWYVSNGKKNNYEYHTLSIYIKTSLDTYMQISTEIYGSENVEKRLCKAINIIKTIEFI